MTDAIAPTQKVMYREQLRGALIFRKKFGREDRWRSYIQILGHNFYGGTTLKADSPTINLVAARVRAQPPKLAFGIPSFKVTAWGPAPTPNSEAGWEAFCSMEWETEGMDVTTRRCTLDWPTFGMGIGFVGFEKAFSGQIVDSKRRLFGAVPPAVTEKLPPLGGLTDMLSTTTETPMDIMLRQRIFEDRVSVLNFVIDPCADSWDDAQFMARRIHLPYSRAKMMFGKDCPTAESLANVALFTDGGEEDPFGDKPTDDLASKMPDAVKRVSVWELWNISEKKTVYLDAKGNVIGNSIYPWRSPHPGFPFVPLLWDEIPDMVWSEGLAAAIKPMNDELHIYRSRELTESKKPIGVLRVDPGVKKESKVAAKSGRDGIVIEAGEGEVEWLNRQVYPQQWDTIEDRIRHDIDEVTHTSPYGASAAPAVRQSATAVSAIVGAGDAIDSYRKSNVEKYASQLAERMMAIAMATFDEPIQLSIVNRDPQMGDLGAPIIFPFVPTDHAGTYKVITIEDTMQAQAKDVERSQKAQAFQLFSPMPWFKAREAAADFYSSMPSVRDPFKFILTEQELATQQQQQAQQQPPLPPEQGGEQPDQGQMMPPQQQAMLGPGPGSGNMTADMMAAINGAQAPMTGGASAMMAPSMGGY